MTVKRFALGCTAIIAAFGFLLTSCDMGGEEVDTGFWHFDGGDFPDPNAPPENITGPRGWERRPGQWELVWNDEFVGTELDRTIWNVDTGTGRQFGPNLVGWGNNEFQYYREENIRVQNGVLIIEVCNVPYVGGNSQSRNFTSGKLTSGGTRASGVDSFYDGPVYSERFSISEGFLEARIRTPRGLGFWPAFWTLGTNSNRYGNGGPESHVGWPSSGEIDIMEMRGGQEHIHMSTIHHGRSFPNQWWFPGRSVDVRTFDLPSGVDMSSHFHVYGVRWDATAIHFYFNGYNWFSIDLRHLDGGANANGEAFTHHLGQFININLAVGGNFINNVAPSPALFADNAPWENRSLMVDWVRAYRRIGGPGVVRINGEIVQ